MQLSIKYFMNLPSYFQPETCRWKL